MITLIACVSWTLLMTGCQVLAPIAIPPSEPFIAEALLDDSDPQFELGKPQPFVDGLGWVVGIPGKLLLWDRRIDQHKISESTVLTLADYLEDSNLPHVKVRVNQYAPLKDWGRLKKNRTVAWPYRYTMGLVSLAGETLLPGRIFGGDHFNPYTQTVHLYSDVPSIALHEGAHAKDFTRRKYQGTYAALYGILPIWHETIASEDAMAYIKHTGDQALQREANRILYPAYGTYVGSAVSPLFPAASTPIYYGSVLAGHINGRLLNRQLRQP